MTDTTARNRSQVIFVSSGGNDDATGFTDNNAKQSLSEAITAANALNPTQPNPVSIIELGRSPYTGNFSFEPYVSVDLPLSRVVGSVDQLPDSSQFNLLSVFTTGVGNETAIRSNSSDLTGIDVKGLLCVGDSDIGLLIDGTTTGFFGNVGLCQMFQSNSKGFSYTSTGDPEDIFFRKIQLDGSTSVGFEMDTTSTETLSFRSGKIQGNAGTGNIGINALNGVCYAQVNEIKCDGNVAITTQAGAVFDVNAGIVGGDINCVGGELTVTLQSHTGDTTNNTNLIFTAQDDTGDFTNSAGVALYKAQLSAGDVILDGGVTTVDIQALTGNYTSNSGLHYLRSQVMVGNAEFNSGSTTRVDIDSILGNFTVNAGANVKGQISEVTGGIFIDAAGIFNGEIDGVEYGSWVDSTQNITNGIRNGAIQGSYGDACLRVTIDTTTDVIDEIKCSYFQNPNASREVGFRLIDADTSTVYFEDTNTDTTTGTKYFDLTTVINALPVNQVVNLLVEAERVSGAGTQDAACQFTITRTL